MCHFHLLNSNKLSFATGPRNSFALCYLPQARQKVPISSRTEDQYVGVTQHLTELW